jgi:hypothetical protein
MGIRVAIQENFLNTRVFSTLRLSAEMYVGRSGRFDKLLLVFVSTDNLGFGSRLPRPFIFF